MLLNCAVLTWILQLTTIVSSEFDPIQFNEKLNLKTQKYIQLNLPLVANRFYPEFPEKKPESFQNAPCTPGFVGDNCTIPTCYNKTNPILQHDGSADYGDLIESDFSSTCSDTFSFYIDNFINEFFVILNSIEAGNPKAIVYNPAGGQVAACGEFAKTKSQTIKLFCNGKDIHGTGEYKVKLTADNAKPCVFEIRAPTNLSIDGGFISDQRDDDVQQVIWETANQGIFRYPIENENFYLAFKIKQEEFPTHPTEVHIYSNAIYDQKLNLQLRYGCNTPHITSQPYKCTSENLYHVKFRGYDNDGNRFQRIYDFYCEAKEVGTTPINNFTTTLPSFCENGGILYNETCYCGDFFTGTNCETSQCINGGLKLPNDAGCLCQPGYSGDHCQHVTCSIRSSDNFDEAESALGFVIRASSSMAAQLDEIVAAAEKIVDFYEANYPIFFQSYILTVVADNEILFSNEFETGEAFVASIKSIISPKTETECDEALLAGISKTLDSSSFKKYPNSPVFVFSDGTSNDDFTVVGYLMEQIVNTRAQVFFMLTNSASGKCNVDVSSTNYEQLRSISRLSRGLLVQTSLTQLREATSALAQDLWQYDTILTNDLQDCRKAPLFQPFFIDQSIDYLALKATGSNLAPIITFPNLTQITPPLFYANGDVYVWRTAKPPVGAYFLTINSNSTHSSTCQYRLSGRSTYRLYLSVTDLFDTDNIHNAPVYQSGSHLVARMDSLFVDDPLSATIEATVWYNDPLTNTRQVLYASSGIWRDACQYEMYFGEFQCPQPYLPLYVNVYTNDVFGQVVLRTATTYCSAAAPNPIDSNCLNGGVYYNNTCICPAHFTGDKCQKISCENGGSALFGACQCVAGYSGQFCEVVKCFEQNSYGFWGYNHKSLTIMLHDSLTTRSSLRSINDVAPDVIHDILYQHPKWISNYQLIQFNDTNHNLIVDSENGQDLITGINKLYQKNRQHTGYSCENLNFYPTLLETISHVNIQWGGIVYVFLYGHPKQDLIEYQQILKRVEINKLQINIVQSSLNPCGENNANDGLLSLTQFSGGSFFTTTVMNSGNVFNQIPTNYMSSLIYENSVEDCSDAVFYVPIDDGTQSFSTYVQGFLTSDPIYSSPGENDATIYNIFNDFGTNSRLDYIVRACDDGWYSHGTHCIRYSYEQTSYYEALASCHNDGATLVTVFTEAEQQALNGDTKGVNFWIGLNDVLTPGTFEWDTIDGNLTITLADTKYTYWLPGQPEISNDKKCVLDSNNNNHGWSTEKCTEKHYYACQKHAYTANYSSYNENINHLSRGIWKINIKGQGACSILVRSQSAVQVATRFSSNIHDDVGNDEPNKNTDVNRLIVYANGLKNHRAVEYAHFYFNNLTLLQAQTLSYRENCMFSFISSSFKCPNLFYQMLITGVDDSGNLYQRIVPAACTGGIDENSCTNGGVYNNGKCICPPNFYGDSCQYAYCENGGYISASLSSCTCPNGWDGQFCEIPLCTRNQLDVPEISNIHRTFIVAVDGTSNGDMKTVVDNFNTTLTSVLNSTLTRNPAWFTNFVGIVFRDAEAIRANPPLQSVSEVFTANNVQDFVTLISNELEAHPYTATQQKRDIFTAIVKTLTQNNVVPNSKIFVITAGNAEDTIDRNTVLSSLALSHSSVHFFFIGDSKPPGDATSYNDPTVSTLIETAHITGGTSYQLSSPSDLKSAWDAVLITLHNSYYVISHTLKNCSDYQDYIQIDSNGTDVIVDVFSQYSTDIAVFDTKYERLNTVQVLKSKTNLVSAFSTTNTLPGIFTVDIDYAMANPGPCTLNIRAQSNLEVDLGFTQDVAFDNGWHDGSAVLYPRSGDFSNAIVAKVSEGSVLTFAQIYDLSEIRLAWASPLIARTGCAYNYISERTFQCYKNSFVISIDGLDENGHPFRRTFTIHCDGEVRPQPTAPSQTTTVPSTTNTVPSQSTFPTLAPCDPTTTKIDVIIALDGSSGITEDMYYATVGTIREIGNSLNIGPNNSRILLGTYDASTHFNGDLNTITNFDQYVSELSEVMSFGYTGVNGNNIQGLFDYIVSENNTAPLRPAPVRKFLLFLSSQGWDKGNDVDGIEQGFGDPTVTANSLHQARLEMFAIGLGSSANMTQLANIAKCHRQVNDVTQLQSAVDYALGLFCGSNAIC